MKSPLGPKVLGQEVLYISFCFEGGTQSLFMCFWGERRLGVRLRRARGLMSRDEGKIANPIFKTYLTFLLFSQHPARVINLK